MLDIRILVLGILLGIAAADTTADEVSCMGDTATGIVQTSPRPSPHSSRDNPTIDLFRRLGKDSIWTRVTTIKMDWQTFHTQGLVKIGDTFFVSAVEVVEKTVRSGTETDALSDFSIDRSPGSGRAWLFKFNGAGALLGRIELTGGTKYHPGGLDYDGKYIWVPVAEYRPNSRTDVYRVDPNTLAAVLSFTVNDHIGAIVHNIHRGTFHGVSWGSRRLYTWKIAEGNVSAGSAGSENVGRKNVGKKNTAKPAVENAVKNAGPQRPPGVVSSNWTPNTQSYIDYQDCHYQGAEYMLCGGVGGYATPRGSIAFGGLDLVDLRTARPEHQIPVNLFVDEGHGDNAGLALTHNAFWVEPLHDGSMRAYFMTESDNQADLLVYDATPWADR